MRERDKTLNPKMIGERERERERESRPMNPKKSSVCQLECPSVEQVPWLEADKERHRKNTIKHIHHKSQIKGNTYNKRHAS